MDVVHSKGGYVPLYGEIEEKFEGDKLIASLEFDIRQAYLRS